MRPTERGAAGRGQPDRTAEEEQRADILPPALELGNCATCGAHIRLTRGGAPTCPTCSAWRRWYLAHLAASRALQEIPR